MTTPSLWRLTTCTYASGSSCLPGGRERSPLASVMHWVMRMSRRWASSMKAFIGSRYFGAVSLIRPHTVASVMIDVYVTWLIMPLW
ncbi:unannotated protein [freshwater metagenome]|uniref:Unannotated protein n=1 Tax=freshwater metagenome TaxID=449393 RepID=A0A6J6V9C7_9ZZZZ